MRNALPRPRGRSGLTARARPAEMLSSGWRPLALTLASLVVAFVTAAGSATASPSAGERRIASYCSPSGDVCYGVFNRGGQIILRITTAARYFQRYTLCVTRLPRGTNPEHAQRCGWFPLFGQSGSTWGSSVNYARQFVGPVAHPFTPLSGRYRVTWRNVCSACPSAERRHSDGGSPLGPSLFFRLPLRR